MSVLRQLIHVETYERGTEIAKLALYERDGEYKLVRYAVTIDGEEENYLLYNGANLQTAFMKLDGEKRLLRFTEYAPIHPAEPVMTRADWNKDMLALAQSYYSPDALGLLREWRKRIADAMNVAPYMVLEDKVLFLLATFMPQTKEEFLSLPHCGEKRWEQYGAELLALLRGQAPAFYIPSAVLEGAQPVRTQKQERQVKLLTRLQEETPELEELARELDVSVNTVIGYLEKLVEDGYDIEAYVAFLTREVPYSEISAVIDSVGADKLKPIYLELNGDVPPYEARISYHQIRLALVRKKMEQASVE